MKNSSLAECIEAYDASVRSPRPAQAPADRTRPVFPVDDLARGADSVMRRTARARRIQIRDQGLRPFRVC